MVSVSIRLLCMFFCSYGGYRVAVILNDNYISESPQQSLAITAGIIVGILVGYVIGGVIGRYGTRLLGGAEASFLNVSGAELFFGVAGALVGLLIALIPSIALFRFGYAGYVASTLLFLICGFGGMRISVLKRSELSSMFKLGPSLHDNARGTAIILDTSVIIDGRIVDIVKSGFLEGTMVVPRFVLQELQSIADSSEELKRNRGRRGLEVLNALQHLERAKVEITEQDFHEIASVDGKLIALSRLTGVPLTTNDFNLNRVAEIQGVKVLNINELANAVKPVVLPGEEMKLKIIREGKEPGQGVGFLDDGTMVVVDKAKNKVGMEVQVVTTSILQTPAGKMIFAGLREGSRGD